MLEAVKHLGSIATDKYIVVAFEKTIISDKLRTTTTSPYQKRKKYSLWMTNQI
jgi:hypothetical protein